MTSLNIHTVPDASGRHLKTLPKNFIHLKEDITEDNLREVVEELQHNQRQIILAIEELQQFQFRARRVDADGMPSNGSVCEALGGQFLRLTQSGAAGNLQRIEHGLRRIPQGAIWILQAADVNRVYITDEVDGTIEPATEHHITVRLNSPSTTTVHILLLF
tara:strand:- start:12015 stop:12497 length:483 start_codon:yes stop_codon:yes gene_type:complete